MWPLESKWLLERLKNNILIKYQGKCDRWNYAKFEKKWVLERNNKERLKKYIF